MGGVHEEGKLSTVLILICQGRLCWLSALQSAILTMYKAGPKHLLLFNDLKFLEEGGTLRFCSPITMCQVLVVLSRIWGRGRDGGGGGRGSLLAGRDGECYPQRRQEQALCAVQLPEPSGPIQVSSDLCCATSPTISSTARTTKQLLMMQPPFAV